MEDVEREGCLLTTLQPPLHSEPFPNGNAFPAAPQWKQHAQGAAQQEKCEPKSLKEGALCNSASLSAELSSPGVSYQVTLGLNEVTAAELWFLLAPGVASG